MPPALRADALRAHGGATDIAGDDDAARRLYEQSLALFELLGDERGRAVLLHRLGINAMRRGDLTLAPNAQATGGVRRRRSEHSEQSHATAETISARVSSSSQARRWHARPACGGGRAECSPSWRASP